MPKVGMEPIRRKQLIGATCYSIGENGFAGTTIQSIARRAGLSAGVIPHYFGSKLGLLEAAMRELLTQLKVDLIHRLPEAPTPRQRIHAIIEANFSLTQTDPLSARTWLGFWSNAMHEPVFARLQIINKRRLHSNLKYSFKGMGVNDADMAAASLAALIDGLWLRGALSPEGIDAEHAIQVCKHHVDLLSQSVNNHSTSPIR